MDGFAGLGVVGDDDAGGEEAGELLPPGGPGFDVLVDHGGVAGEVEDGLGFGADEGLDGDGADAGVDAVELEGELVRPSPGCRSRGALRRTRPAVPSGLVNSAMRTLTSKCARDGFAGGDGELLEHEAAGFGADGDGGGCAPPSARVTR